MDQARLATGQDVFDVHKDDEELVRDLFNRIDSNGNGTISEEEMREMLSTLTGEHHKELAEALRNVMDKHFKPQPQQAAVEITFKTFLEALREVPSVRGERVHWCSTLHLDFELARLLPKGDLFDGLSAIKKMTPAEADQVCLEFHKRMRAAFNRALETLQNQEVTSALAFKNSKFSMEDAFEGSFASLQQFHDGPEKVIGTPNPQVVLGMRREHCDRPNAKEPFTTTNYGITTCPAIEWEIVAEPEKEKRYPHVPKDKSDWDLRAAGWKPPMVPWEGEAGGRDLVPLENFTQLEVATKAGLQKGEVVAVRLYTGPMFCVYNAVLRQHPEHLFEALAGNQYETTVFCIISAILKLSKLTKMPPGRRLYRGLGGMILPVEFWKEKEGFRGGVEWGFMSTTTHRSLALQYSGLDKKRGTVFEIEAGRVDIGTDLGWLSQYPGEEEYLFPPLCCLEVIRQPRIEGEVIVFPLRVNVCHKGLTLEQLVERRKNLHLAMAKNLGEELSFAAAAVVADLQVLLNHPRRGGTHVGN